MGNEINNQTTDQFVPYLQNAYGDQTYKNDYVEAIEQAKSQGIVSQKEAGWVMRLLNALEKGKGLLTQELESKHHLRIPNALDNRNRILDKLKTKKIVTCQGKNCPWGTEGVDNSKLPSLEVRRKQTLALNLDSSKVIFNRLLTTSTYDNRVYANMSYELFFIDEQLNIHPRMALNFERSPDRKKVTIKINPEIKWSGGLIGTPSENYEGGRPVTAKDFALGVKIILDSRVGSPKFGSLKLLDPSNPVTIIDDWTLQFNFQKPDLEINHMQAINEVCALPSFVFESEDIDTTYLRDHWISKYPLSYGPYRLHTYAIDKIGLVPNEHWNGPVKRNPKIKKIIYINFPEEASNAKRINFINGRIDAISGALPEDYSFVTKDRPNTKVYHSQKDSSGFMSFNQHDPEAAKIAFATTKKANALLADLLQSMVNEENQSIIDAKLQKVLKAMDKISSVYDPILGERQKDFPSYEDRIEATQKLAKFWKDLKSAPDNPAAITNFENSKVEVKKNQTTPDLYRIKRNKFFGDSRVRKAFVLASNRQRIIDAFFKSKDGTITQAEIPSGFIPTHFAAHNGEISTPEYSPKKAKQLLAEAGWVNRDDDVWLENQAGEEFRFDFLLTTPAQPLTTTLQANLKDVGIEMNFSTVEWGLLQEKRGRRDFYSHFQGFAPENRAALADILSAFSSFNYGGQFSAELEYKLAEEASSLAEQLEISKVAQKYYEENFNRLYVYRRRTILLVGAGLTIKDVPEASIGTYQTDPLKELWRWSRIEN